MARTPWRWQGDGPACPQAKAFQLAAGLGGHSCARALPLWMSRPSYRLAANQPFSAASFSAEAGARSTLSPQPHALFWLGLLNTNPDDILSTR